MYEISKTKSTAFLTYQPIFCKGRKRITDLGCDAGLIRRNIEMQLLTKLEEDNNVKK